MGPAPVDRLAGAGAAAVLLADDDPRGRRLAVLEGAADPTHALADAVERARTVSVAVERCEVMGRAPPGPGWDGVFEMHAK